MGVRLVGQTKVAFVLGLVLGLAHGAQHHCLDHVAIRALQNLFAQVLEDIRLWRRPFRPGDTQAQPTQELLQLTQALFLGRLVVPVKRRHTGLFQQFGRTDVGGQHGLLDHDMRHIALHRHDGFDLLVLVVNNTGVIAIEIDGTALCTTTAQGQEHFVERPDHVQGLIVQAGHGVLGQFGLRLFDDRANLVVGQTVPRAHHPFTENKPGEATVGGNLHVAVQAQAVHMGVQGT